MMLLFALTLVRTLFASTAFAQQPALIPESGSLGPECNFITGEFDFICIPLYLAYLIQIVFSFVGGLALTHIMFAGYQLAWSGLSGDKERGKSRLTWALIGLAVSVLAYFIVNLLVSTITSPP